MKHVTDHSVCWNSTLDSCWTNCSILSKLAASHDVHRQVNLNVFRLCLVHHLINNLWTFFIVQWLSNLYHISGRLFLFHQSVVRKVRKIRKTATKNKHQGLNSSRSPVNQSGDDVRHNSIGRLPLLYIRSLVILAAIKPHHLLGTIKLRC